MSELSHSLPSGQPRIWLVRDEESPPYDADHAPPVQRERFVMLPVDVLLDTDLSDKALRLYLVLLHHRNAQTGQCNPSRKLLAKELGCDVKTVTRMCAELERFGLVERTQPNAGGVTHYVLPLRTVAYTPPQECPYPPVKDVPTPSAGMSPRTIGSEQDEKEQEVNPPIPPSPAKATKPEAKATTIPDDFTVSDEMRTKAVGYGVPAEAVDLETEKWRNHHEAVGNRFKNWRSAWFKWMANAPQMSGYNRRPPSGGYRNGRQTDDERDAVKQEALRRLGVRPATPPEPSNVFETRGTVR